MPFATRVPRLASGCIALAVLFSSVYLAVRRSRRKAIRARLPQDLLSWREPLDKNGKLDVAVWDCLSDHFQRRGYTFWRRAQRMLRQDLDPPKVVSLRGFGYARAHEGWDRMSNFDFLHEFNYPTHAVHAANTREGQAVVIRVLAVGNQGCDHVTILRFIASTYHATASRNHALPLLNVSYFEDILFGIFPMVGQDLRDLLYPFRKNSVGDIVDIIMQCLEALDYIHGENIAHRDAYKENFLLQYYPQSLVNDPLRITRPRVFLHDFEVSVMFENLPREKHLCIGVPQGGTVPFSPDFNGRASPEVLTGEPYCPYKLDVWQLGKSFTDFKSTVPAIDAILERMHEPDPALRPTASEALGQLADFVAATPPRDLLIPPTTPHSHPPS
ncbi:kinase-like domain-containing protein [Epithele typhae]|uniref:kinase-like domain-containing protein n=1 Tax=Epithele typhae TaxID=378194 RepID=UPI0020075458|nr:kinase-like domain-containing protein [Epithele typhae]KAH9928467.1 kinase-like domain-containing protein [Epithele typhae]